MMRRHFLKTGGAALALSGVYPEAPALAETHLRVGLKAKCASCKTRLPG